MTKGTTLNFNFTDDVVGEVTQDEMTETHAFRQVAPRHENTTMTRCTRPTKTQYPPRYILPLLGKCRPDISKKKKTMGRVGLLVLISA